MRRMVQNDTTSIKIGHALGARNEMTTIADEFRALVATTSIPTPAMDRLYRYLDPAAEPIADGSADVSVKWGGVWALGVAVGAVALLVAMLWSGAP